MTAEPADLGLVELDAVATELLRRGSGDLATRVRGAAVRLRQLLGSQRDNLRELDGRLDDILQVVTAMTALDFDRKVEVLDEDDWLIKALGFGLNLMGDELKRTTEELTETRDRALAASRAKSSFLANMSHELRTPLNAIIGYSELLREECEHQLEPAQVGDIDRIVAAARHLLALIKDTLDLSKIEAGKMELVPEVFDVGELVDEVAATLLPLVQERGNRLVVERGDGLGTMYSDRTKLAQNLYNLLNNANKFTSLGTIRFVVRVLSGGGGLRYEFTVEDTGIGIPHEKLESVFGAFDQGDERVARRFGGTGLGLAITRHFCEMLGGEIRVRSELGRGSAFTFVVPGALPEAVARPAPAVSRPVHSALLLASPDPLFVELVRLYLEGVTIVPVSTSVEVVRLALALRPAAILIDDSLGEGETRSTLLALKAETELTAVPVHIASSAADSSATRAHGAADVLKKPLSRKSLQPLLARLSAPPALGRLLVVAGADAQRSVPRRMLAGRGWQLHNAADADAVAAALADVRFDAVIVDPSIPALPAVLALVRGLPVFGVMPTVAVVPADPSIVVAPPERLLELLVEHVHAARAGETGDCSSRRGRPTLVIAPDPRPAPPTSPETP